MPWLVLRRLLCERWGDCPPWVVDEAPDGYVQAEILLMAAERRGADIRAEDDAKRDHARRMIGMVNG
jgi:hypothetical protein